MKRFLLAFVVFGWGCASAAEPPPLFASEEQAVSAIADLGPLWRAQTAPPRDLHRSTVTFPTLAIRGFVQRRRLFYAGGRAVTLEWREEGTLDLISLYDPACWQEGRREVFMVLLRHIQGEEANLPILLSAAERVFDHNYERGYGVRVAPQRVFHLGRTSKDYGCGIDMRREPQRRI